MADRKRSRPKRKKKGPFDDLKVEVAAELGLMDKVQEMGWAELTAAESGRIGGVMTRRLRRLGLLPRSGHQPTTAPAASAETETATQPSPGPGEEGSGTVVVE